MTYEIHPITCATLDSTKGSFTYLVDEGVELSIPVLTFLLDPDDPADPVILVDTGIAEPDERGLVNGKPVEGGGFAPLERGLADRGYDAADVDYVVLTHLHHDHTGNVGRFPNAEYVVQKRELASAEDPLDIMDRVYDPGHLDALKRQAVRVVDGDYSLAPGVELLLAPGHTPGMQALVVETAAGTYGLTADLAYCEHNLDPSLSEIVDGAGERIPTTPQDVEYLPPGIHVDVAACCESVERLRAAVGPDGTLVPGHAGGVVGDSYP
jgi:glyoxylase-like metal-dependent hydrolase (beta-lactamase superfamily II)